MERLHQQTSAPNWDYDALLLGWSLATFPDQYDIFHSSQSKAGLNNIWYKNEEVDKLLVNAKKLKDRKEYSKAYEKIYKMIAEDQPYTFLFYYNYHRAIPKNLQGFEFHPKNDFYEVNKWWLELGADGRGGKHLYLDEKDHTIMNGREVFKFAGAESRLCWRRKQCRAFAVNRLRESGMRHYGGFTQRV